MYLPFASCRVLCSANSFEGEFVVGTLLLANTVMAKTTSRVFIGTLCAASLLGSACASSKDPVLPKFPAIPEHYSEIDPVDSAAVKARTGVSYGPGTDIVIRDTTFSSNQPTSDPGVSWSQVTYVADIRVDEVNKAPNIPVDKDATSREEHESRESVRRIVYLDGTEDLMFSDRRLPHAELNARGLIRGVAFPVSLGGKQPSRDPHEYAAALFGPEGYLAEFTEMSGGRLRVEIDVFPALMDPAISDLDIAGTIGARRNVERLTRRVYEEWAARANFARYDNDGPDGRPMSGDDDGRIDLGYLIIETNAYPAILEVGPAMELPVGLGGRLRLDAPRTHVLAIPPKEIGDVVGEDLLSFHTLKFFDALGVPFNEAYFPAPLENQVSTAAKIRLGWMDVVTVREPGTYFVESPRIGVVLPIAKTNNKLYWLIERRDGILYVSQALREKDRFKTLSVYAYAPAPDPIALPLSTNEKDTIEALLDWPDQDATLGIIVRKKTW